jgi:para-nitrobenzyl esterase
MPVDDSSRVGADAGLTGRCLQFARAGKDHMRTTVAALAGWLAFATVASAWADPVKVSGGLIEGASENGLTVYRGIPFAAPPVGGLRWKAPQPVAAWSGVRKTAEFGPACMQGERTLFPDDKVQSEDCLTLNVWTPATSAAERLPVMVWIYGGGFTMGSTRAPLYSGANFARQGVVLVSVQYRVGRFGFFAHPALTREDPNAPVGNYGILDQIAGLRWVRDNIAAFGGDPGNVTIFGESAGGVSVNALVASPLARGLFHKAISESGFGRSLGVTLQVAERQGVAFAAQHEISGEGSAAIAALRALPPDQILAPNASAGTGVPPASADTPRQPGGAPGGLPYPMVDGKVLPAQIDEIFEAGRQAHVPYIAGGNSYEASLFGFVRQQPQAAFDRTGNAAKASQLYVAGGRDAGLGALDLTTDLQVTEPNRYLGRLMAKAGAPAYAYYFSYVAPAQRGTAPGTPHGGELAYVFGTLPSTAAEDARELSRAMSAYWVAFAKSGNPGSAGGAKWEPVTTRGYAFMEFGLEGVRLRPGFLESKLDFISGLEAEAASKR